MKPFLSFSVKTGLSAFCLVGALSAQSLAGPLPASAPAIPLANSVETGVIPVREGWAGNNQQAEKRWRKRQYRQGRRFQQRPRHNRNFYRGSGIFFGLGLGAPAYRYRVEPRRHYRPRRLSNSHVNWCYSRYRSYRAWDNTFQPYHGPRKPCYSPYR